MMNRLISWFSTKATPQAEPIPGSAQVPNEAGGYAWAVDDWTRLDRFLVLGSEGGTYYASERGLTIENAQGVLRCLSRDGPRVVRRVVEISTAGRAPKAEPAIFALALALKKGDLETRRAARAAVPLVCRTGTHLFALAEAVGGLGGWGRGTQGAFADWYAGKDASEVAFQAVKYQRRNGWSHRDLLRKAHVRPPGEAHDAVFRWITRGDVPTGIERIEAFEQAKRAVNASEITALIRGSDLPREAIPTVWLKDPDVWAALLQRMPVTATLRNLAKMTETGLVRPGSDGARVVADRLTNGDALRKARVHPLAVLVALLTYKSGRGVRGKLSWTPVASVVDALDAAFYASFRNVEPTGRRFVLALDVSGSMSCGAVAGLPGVTPRVAAAAMAMVTARTERRHEILAFSQQMVPLTVSPRQRLDDVVAATARLPFGGTDCALPMTHALARGIAADVFVVYTDSETWFGQIHPAQALRRYREKTGIAAKLVVVGMTSNGFTIADPDDAGMLDVVGFDTATPDVLRGFVA